MLMNLIRILAAQNSGFSIGLTGATTGVTGSILGGLQIQYAYLDIENLKGYTADKTVNPETSDVLVFDPDEPGIVKTKKVKFNKIFSDGYLAIDSPKGTISKQKSVSGDFLSLDVVLGGITSTVDGFGLVKGATVYQYVTENTVASFDGKTGNITVVDGGTY